MYNKKKGEKLNIMCKHCNHDRSLSIELDQILRDEKEITEGLTKCELCGNLDNVQSKYGIAICEKCIHKFANEIKYSNKENFSHGIHLIKDGILQ